MRIAIIVTALLISLGTFAQQSVTRSKIVEATETLKAPVSVVSDTAANRLVVQNAAGEYKQLSYFPGTQGVTRVGQVGKNKFQILASAIVVARRVDIAGTNDSISWFFFDEATAHITRFFNSITTNSNNILGIGFPNGSTTAIT